MDVVLVVGDDPSSFLQLRQEHLLLRLLDLPILSRRSFPRLKHNLSFPWEWQPGERRRTWLRNLADARLVAYGRLLEELDSEYLHRFGTLERGTKRQRRAAACAGAARSNTNACLSQRASTARLYSKPVCV